DLRKGSLRMGASTTVAGYWLPPHVATFVQRFPGVDFGLQVGNTAGIGHAIAEGRIDVAFVEGVVDDPGIVATPWRDEPLQVVVAADAKLGAKRRASVAELARQPWLLREAGSGTRQVAQRLLRSRGIKPTRLIELGSNEAIAHAVAAGAGVALLPAIVVQDLLAMHRVRIVRLAGADDIVRPLYRLELANRPRAPALQAFLDLVETPPPS
ncbi:MAG: LysR substrate-binding domain-containing protein, partial [Luteimonas sp.]|nr:LysR substrate-binding domain-containing protein [Luteimonas sp.]